MTVDGSLLMFGNRVIWQLKTTGGEDYWDQVGEMETDEDVPKVPGIPYITESSTGQVFIAWNEN